MRDVPAGSSCPLTDGEKEQVVKVLRGGVESHKELEVFKHFRGFDPRFVPHSLYLPLLSHKLNNYKLTKLFEHKALLGFLRPGGMRFPHCVVRRIDGEVYGDDMRQLGMEEAVELCASQDVLVFKPAAETSGGLGVDVVEMTGMSQAQRRELMRDRLRSAQGDFVAQKRVTQSPGMARFNTDSVNTLRVTSLYLNGRCSTLRVMLRMGKTGARVDNWGNGGIAVGVATDGRLAATGYDNKFNEIRQHNGVTFDGTRIDELPSLLERVEGAHVADFPLCKLIGWDVTFDAADEPVVLEVNSSQPGIFIEQLCSGPIFGDRTDEVMDYCAQKEFKYGRCLFTY